MIQNEDVDNEQCRQQYASASRYSLPCCNQDIDRYRNLPAPRQQQERKKRDKVKEEIK